MAHEPISDYYKLLGLTPAATIEEIQTAYTAMYSHWQELAVQGDEQAAEQLRLLDEAYAELADPNRRMAYDRVLSSVGSGMELALASQPRGITLAEEQVIPLLQRRCPHCGELNPIQLSLCQSCGQQISRTCPHCGQSVSLDQAICPRCEIPIQEYDQRRFAEAMAIDRRVQRERRESEAQVQVLEAMHTAMRQQGAIFWLGVLVACIALAIIAAFVAILFSG